MAAFVRVLAILMVLVVLAGAGLYIYGQGLEAPVKPVEKVLPDERFPR